MSWGQIQDLLRFFKEHDFCSDDTLVKLLNTPKMRTQIRGHEAELARLVPWFTKWAKADVRRSRQERRVVACRNQIPIARAVPVNSPPATRHDSRLVKTIAP